jgi:hypothetical protein
MNYRQWKKNYKKRHGVNPPISADKRKQRKLVAKAFVAFANADFSAAVNKAVANMVKALAKAMRTLGESADNAGTAFKNVAGALYPLEIKGQAISWEVKPIVCDWGIYENDALSGSSELKFIINSRRTADKIVELLQQDHLEAIRFNAPDRIQRRQIDAEEGTN